MKTLKQDGGSHEQIISYQKLRTFIGIIGILLPVLTVGGSFVFGAKEYSWQHSISHFYYSKMHIIFIGTLCVLGGFLITYKGRPDDKWESRVSNIAGYCAFGIASFPTQFDGFRPSTGGSNQFFTLTNPVTDFWGNMHFAFAGALFACFVIFCLHFFQKPDKVYTEPEEQLKFRRRRRLYKFCGWGIAISIAAIAIFNAAMHDKKGIFAYSTFIFETTALWCFGTAWLVKGSLVLKNVPVIKDIIKPIR